MYPINREESSSFVVETDEQHPCIMKELLAAVAYLEPVPLSILQHALHGPLALQELKDVLDEAFKRNWLLLEEKSDETTYRLASDGHKSKLSSYGDVSTRSKIHLEYGRRIWNNIVSQEDLKHASSFILDQFLHSTERISLLDGLERHSLARLCLIAGTSAAKSSEFTQALTYSEFGIELLGDTAWNSDTYDLSLALHNAAAEMLLVKTDYGPMGKYIDAVIENATNLQDTLLAKCTRLSAMGASQDENAAIDYAIEILETLGEKIPRRGNHLQIIWRAAVVKRLIGTKTDADFLLMEPMTDPSKLMCMRIISTIFLRTIFVRPNLVALTGCKFMELTLRYGMSTLSPNAFACYSLILGKSGALRSADRSGRLSIAMLDQLAIKESLPRVYAAYYGTVFSSTNPSRGPLPKLLQAYEVGLETGDLEFACFNISLYCMVALSAGVTLTEIKSTWEHSRQLMESLKQEALLRFSWGSMQAVYTYMGIATGSEHMFNDPDGVCHMGSMVNYVRVPQLIVAYIFDKEEFPTLESCIKSAKTSPRMDYFIQWIYSLCLLKLARSGKTSKWKAIRHVWQTCNVCNDSNSSAPSIFLRKCFFWKLK